MAIITGDNTDNFLAGLDLMNSLFGLGGDDQIYAYGGTISVNDGDNNELKPVRI